MNPKRAQWVVILIFLGNLLAISLSVSAQKIPLEYSSLVYTDRYYSYDITEFGTSIDWEDIDDSQQIKTTLSNLEGYTLDVQVYEFKDEKTAGDYSSGAFPDRAPHVNLDVKDENGVSTQKILEIPNAEAAINLKLGASNFLSGFLVPVRDLTNLTNAAEKASFSATIYDYTLYFELESSTTDKMELWYDIDSGLLVKADVKQGAHVFSCTQQGYQHIDNLTGDRLPTLPGYPLLITIISMGISIVMLARRNNKNKKC